MSLTLSEDITWTSLLQTHKTERAMNWSHTDNTTSLNCEQNITTPYWGKGSETKKK